MSKLEGTWRVKRVRGQGVRLGRLATKCGTGSCVPVLPEESSSIHSWSSVYFFCNPVFHQQHSLPFLVCCVQAELLVKGLLEPAFHWHCRGRSDLVVTLWGRKAVREARGRRQDAVKVVIVACKGLRSGLVEGQCRWSGMEVRCSGSGVRKVQGVQISWQLKERYNLA